MGVTTHTPLEISIHKALASLDSNMFWVNTKNLGISIHKALASLDSSLKFLCSHTVISIHKALASLDSN